MQPITTSSYTFPDLIEGGYLYVDKTEQLLQLIKQSKGQYFLSRPRRFGKSLLISTLEAIFSGRRELFKGLYIDGKDDGKDRFEWKKYPVIRLDMGSVQAKTPELLEGKLTAMCQRIALALGVEFRTLPQNPGPSDYFQELVERLAAKSREGKVVFNPVSVGNCFRLLEFRNYWFQTATPTFLMDLLKKEPLDVKDLVVSASAFDAYDAEHLAVLPLLVQTGYLTIKELIVEKKKGQWSGKHKKAIPARLSEHGSEGFFQRLRIQARQTGHTGDEADPREEVLRKVS